MALSISAIWKPKEILEIADELDSFLYHNCKNPFICSKSLIDEMESPTFKVIPVILIFKSADQIVGVLPLSLSKTYKVRYAQFLFHYDYSPDFFFASAHRHICIQEALRFIFGHLKCKFLTADLPADSFNVPALESACQAERIRYRMRTDPNMQHCILPVDCTWDDFLKARGTRFRKNLRYNERKISNVGEWKVDSFNNSNNEQEIFNKIMEVEEACWKQQWRENSDKLFDLSLIKSWKWSSFAVKTFPECKQLVWFLYLNGKVIAYTSALEYKGTIYMCKTSFNNDYRNVYPGIFLNNFVIRDCFDSGNIQIIDFITNLPFEEKWSSKRQSRVRILLSGGFFPKLFILAMQRPQLKMFMGHVFPLELINV